MQSKPSVEGAQPGSEAPSRRLCRILDSPRPASAILRDFALEGHRVGFGSAACHHGEIFQGADVDPDTGKQRVILTTVRTPWVGSQASFTPARGGELTIEPAGKKKSLRAAARALEALGCSDYGGEVSVRSFTVQGRGFGASSSDCLATVRAVCDAFHAQLRSPVIARILYEAEGASDPLMFDQDVLFRSREGKVAEDFGGLLPAFDFLGFDVDPEGAGVVTEDCPHPSYDANELECFRPMVGALRHAVRSQDPVLLGRVATASAKVNERYLAKPAFEGILAAAEGTGSLGVSVAHTGTLVTLLFDPRDPAMPKRLDRAEDALAELGFGPFWRSSDGRHL